MAALQGKCAESNKQLFRSLRPIDHAEKLLEITRADAALGRITFPVVSDEFDVESTLLHPRFSCVKTKADGSFSVRAVDHLSWSANNDRREKSVNGHTAASEKLAHESIDLLGAVLEDCCCFLCRC